MPEGSAFVILSSYLIEYEEKLNRLVNLMVTDKKLIAGTKVTDTKKEYKTFHL